MGGSPCGASFRSAVTYGRSWVLTSVIGIPNRKSVSSTDIHFDIPIDLKADNDKTPITLEMMGVQKSQT
jgi:hypothetical protein